jgi:hypothetical protein
VQTSDPGHRPTGELDLPPQALRRHGPGERDQAVRAGRYRDAVVLQPGVAAGCCGRVRRRSRLRCRAPPDDGRAQRRHPTPCPRAHRSPSHRHRQPKRSSSRKGPAPSEDHSSSVRGRRPRRQGGISAARDATFLAVQQRPGRSGCPAEACPTRGSGGDVGLACLLTDSDGRSVYDGTDAAEMFRLYASAAQTAARLGTDRPRWRGSQRARAGLVTRLRRLLHHQ